MTQYGINQKQKKSNKAITALVIIIAVVAVMGIALFIYLNGASSSDGISGRYERPYMDTTVYFDFKSDNTGIYVGSSGTPEEITYSMSGNQINVFNDSTGATLSGTISDDKLEIVLGGLTFTKNSESQYPPVF